MYNRVGVRYRQWYPGKGTATWELARYRYKYRNWIFQKYLGTATGTLYDVGVTKNQICRHKLPFRSLYFFLYCSHP